MTRNNIKMVNLWYLNKEVLTNYLFLRWRNKLLGPLLFDLLPLISRSNMLVKHVEFEWLDHVLAPIQHPRWIWVGGGSWSNRHTQLERLTCGRCMGAIERSAWHHLTVVHLVCNLGWVMLNISFNDNSITNHFGFSLLNHIGDTVVNWILGVIVTVTIILGKKVMLCL